MVKQLKEAISKVEQLKEEEQIEIARLLEAEITWDETFKKTQDQLSNLANEALQEYKSGKTTEKDW
jgi:hypothetical protein